MTDPTATTPGTPWRRRLYNKPWKKWTIGITAGACLLFGARDVGYNLVRGIKKLPEILWYGADDVLLTGYEQGNSEAPKTPAEKPERKAQAEPSDLETKLDAPEIEPQKMINWTIKNEEGFELYKLVVPDTPDVRRIISVYGNVCRSTPNFSDLDATGDALDMDTVDSKLDGKATYEAIQAVAEKALERSRERQSTLRVN